MRDSAGAYGGLVAWTTLSILVWIQWSTDTIALIGSFAASAVLLFDVPQSPLAQPRNVVGGHLASACVGVGVRKLYDTLVHRRCIHDEEVWVGLFGTAATALAIVCMRLTGTTHPPGGGTALVAVVGSATLRGTGIWFLLYPVLAGSTLMVVVAVMAHGLVRRKYPMYWWHPAVADDIICP